MSGPAFDAEIAWRGTTKGGPVAPKAVYTRTTKPKIKDPLLSLLPSLTYRDRRICLALFDHKVLTIHQLQELYFESSRRARRRMLELFRLGLVLRFRPYRQTGSYPYHYVIGPSGLELVAAERGLEDKKLRVRHDRIKKLAASQRLHHQVEVNGFFTRLASATYGSEDLQLVQWWNEERCLKRWDGCIRPDAFGALQSTLGRIRFFLEVDRGTENLNQLSEKRYWLTADMPEAPKLVLFTFPTFRRETTASKALRIPGMVVATTVRHWVQERPLEPIWLPLLSEQRVQIDELAEGGGIVPEPRKGSL